MVLVQTEVIEYLLRQLQAFDEVTLACDRCERQVPLAYLAPCANLAYGFVCNKCLTMMPYEEFKRLRENAP